MSCIATLLLILSRYRCMLPLLHVLVLLYLLFFVGSGRSISGGAKASGQSVVIQRFIWSVLSLSSAWFLNFSGGVRWPDLLHRFKVCTGISCGLPCWVSA